MSQKWPFRGSERKKVPLRGQKKGGLFIAKGAAREKQGRLFLSFHPIIPFCCTLSDPQSLRKRPHASANKWCDFQVRWSGASSDARPRHVESVWSSVFERCKGRAKILKWRLAAEMRAFSLFQLAKSNNHTTSEPHTHVMSNENKFPFKILCRAVACGGAVTAWRGGGDRVREGNFAVTTAGRQLPR